MKKIKMPSKLSAFVSKLDIIVSVGIALACVATLIVSSIQFKNGLTDINSDMVSAHTLPYNPWYIRAKDVRAYSDEEIKAAWKEKPEREELQRFMTTAQKSAYLGMQPHDPGTLADLVIIGTYTGHKQYRYGSFVADVKIDKVLSSPANTSKLRVRGLTTSTYKIPPLDLHKGDTIKIYDEVALRTTHNDEKDFGMFHRNDNPYTWCFPPFKPNGQYLFFLNYAPKTDIAKTSPAKFRIVPSLYGRIPISNGKTFKPNIFCDNSSEQNTTENNTEAAHENSDQQQEDCDEIPKFTYHDATKIDLFVDSPKTEQLYRDTAAKILQKYL